VGTPRFATGDPVDGVRFSGRLYCVSIFVPKILQNLSVAITRYFVSIYPFNFFFFIVELISASQECRAKGLALLKVEMIGKTEREV